MGKAMPEGQARYSQPSIRTELIEDAQLAARAAGVRYASKADLVSQALRRHTEYLLSLARGDAKAPSRGANGAPSGPEGDKAAARRKKARPSKPAPKREVPAVPPGDGDAKDDAEASGGTSRWTCPGCGEEFPLRDRWYHIANAPPCQEKLEELRRRASDYRPDREAAAGDDQRGPPGQTQDASHPGGIPAAAVEAPARPDPKALAKRFREGFLARGLQHKPPSYQLAGVELMADFAGLELDDDVLAEVLAAILEEVRP